VSLATAVVTDYVEPVLWRSLLALVIVVVVVGGVGVDLRGGPFLACFFFLLLLLLWW